MAAIERVFVDARAKPYVSPNNRDVVYFDVWDETRDPPVIIRKTAMTMASLIQLRDDIDALLLPELAKRTGVVTKLANKR